MSDTLTETTTALPAPAARGGVVAPGKLGGVGGLGKFARSGRLVKSGRLGRLGRLARFGRAHSWWVAGAAWAVFVLLTYVAVGGRLSSASSSASPAWAAGP
jgi:hypothetical protein